MVGLNANYVASSVEGDGSRHLEDGRSLRLEALGLMTAGLVHDLNNVIQILSSSVEVIEQHPIIKSTHELQPFIGRAVRSVDTANALARQILAFARGDCQTLDTVDVASSLLGLDRLLRWTSRDVFDLRLHVAASLPTVRCSRWKLENALVNLVLNARDAMVDGGGMVTIGAQLSPDREWLIVTVSDNGHGMTDDVTARAFEPFFSTKLPRRGTGLGLSMVKAFAEEFGGTIDIRSEVGAGTTLTLCLPPYEDPLASGAVIYVAKAEFVSG